MSSKIKSDKIKKVEVAEKKPIKRTSFYATARENTNLPDGTFVKKGERIKVSAEYVGRLKREKDNSFIITQ